MTNMPCGPPKPRNAVCEVLLVFAMRPCATKCGIQYALSRLLVTVENYPNLKANQAFQDLRAQLEGTENRIGIARNRYIKSVEDYNVFIRQLPQNFTAMIFGYKQRPQFTVENEAAVSKPPTVDFGTPKK